MYARLRQVFVSPSSLRREDIVIPPRAGNTATGEVFGVAEIFYHRVADITATGFIHINNQSELIDQTGGTHVSDHGNPWTRDHRFARQSYRRGGRHPRLRCAR